MWEIPSPASLKGVAGALTSGWQISGVYRAQSGYPFTLALNGDRGGSKADTTGSSLGQPPDRLGGAGCETLTNPGDPNRYIKTECFAFPADGVLGNLGRNALQSPGLATLDLVLTKGQKFGGDHGAVPDRDVQRAQSRELLDARDDHLRRPRQSDRQRRRHHRDAHVCPADAARREAALVILLLLPTH